MEILIVLGIKEFLYPSAVQKRISINYAICTTTNDGNLNCNRQHAYIDSDDYVSDLQKINENRIKYISENLYTPLKHQTIMVENVGTEL